MNAKLIKVGIVGVTGYSGREVLDILLSHPNVRVTYVSATNTHGAVTTIWPQLKGMTSLVCRKFDAKAAAKLCEVVFLAVPHTVSMSITPQLLKNNVRVIDLSGDYRLISARAYQVWYGTKHKDAKNLGKAIYGLPEIYKEKIKKATLLSNPGCYPTAALLALAPLVATHISSIQSVTVDAKSGTTGAGKKAVQTMMFSEVNENFKAYKVCSHQHKPEIDQYLSNIASKKISAVFVAHLLPLSRGILETIYVKVNKPFSTDKLLSLYKKFYKTEPFVRVLGKGEQPEIKNVRKTNYCDIGLSVDRENKTIIITCVIDNLTKGAAGQAVQNMNIMCNLKETAGLC